MAEPGQFQLLTASLGGGFTIKMLNIFYQEFRHWLERSRSAKRFVDDHLAPLLKAADELVGKLRSLAENDFRELHNINPTAKTLDSLEFSSLLYLFGRFWARIEIFRQEGLSIALSQDKRGEQLLNFLDCLESRRVRIVDRISQRAAGEVMVEGKDNILNTIAFIDFVKAYETDSETRRWVSPLAKILSRTRHTHERQQLLQYGVVVHALIDTLDPKHFVTRSRPSYPNKLTKRSWRALKYRVFGTYLAFVPSQEKYLGPPKKNISV